MHEAKLSNKTERKTVTMIRFRFLITIGDTNKRDFTLKNEQRVTD